MRQDIKEVVESLCRIYDIEFKDAYSAGKSSYISDVRHLIIYLLYYYFKISKSDLARHFHKNHTTIMHSIKQFDIVLDYSPQLEAKTFQAVEYMMSLQQSFRRKYITYSGFREKSRISLIKTRETFFYNLEKRLAQNIIRY